MRHSCIAAWEVSSEPLVHPSYCKKQYNHSRKLQLDNMYSCSFALTLTLRRSSFLSFGKPQDCVGNMIDTKWSWRWDIHLLSKSLKGKIYWGSSKTSRPLGVRSKERDFVCDDAANLTQLLRWSISKLSKLNLITSSSTTLPWHWCRTTLTVSMNCRAYCSLCSPFIFFTNITVPSNLSLGQIVHKFLHLLDRTLVLTASFGGNFDEIIHPLEGL